MLQCVLTDAWFPPSSLLLKLVGQNPKLAERFHYELADARMQGFSSSLIFFETLARALGLQGWPKILPLDRWFQRKVINALELEVGRQTSTPPMLLSYSYTALEPFRYAKARGWKTVLVQIDPGPEEEKIVAEEVARVPALAGEWNAAPPDYWARWRQECDLADRIIVTSEWSSEGLIRRGM